MLALKQKIKTRAEFLNFCKILSKRLSLNKPISNNGMIDGMVIGFMITTPELTLDMILGDEMGSVLDGTLQKLEQINMWLVNNDTELNKLI